MNISTTNNVTQSHLCKLFFEIDQNGPPTAVRVIFSIVFDLLGSIISAIFSFHFYHGIDISHPVYSIIFTNLLYSTFVSFGSFVTVIIDCLWDSCMANLLTTWMDSGCYFIYLAIRNGHSNS